MSDKLAFISYRREDEGPASRFIKGELDRFFGGNQIFMDVDNIRIGSKWQQEITQSLEKANVLIVAIGKNWLKVQDKNYRRRIDNEDDWVRKEIEYAISRKIEILPLLLGGEIPTAEALPDSLKRLSEIQFQSVSALNWREDIAKLICYLKENGLKALEEAIPYPKPLIGKLFPVPLTSGQIKQILPEILNWHLVEYLTKEEHPQAGLAIEKNFRFKTFEKSIEFMSIMAKHISVIDHHPEWENQWKTLRIRLSTWDIGFKVSNLDIELAKYIDKEFAQFDGADLR